MTDDLIIHDDIPGDALFLGPAIGEYRTKTPMTSDPDPRFADCLALTDTLVFRPWIMGYRVPGFGKLLFRVRLDWRKARAKQARQAYEQSPTVGPVIGALRGLATEAIADELESRLQPIVGRMKGEVDAREVGALIGDAIRFTPIAQTKPQPFIAIDPAGGPDGQ